MGSDLLPFSDLWPLIARELERLPEEKLRLADADRRILRRPAHSAWDLPRADNSAMDGFAVRSADTEVQSPVVLKVLAGDAYAGSSHSMTVAIGSALPIATGGLLPAGADAIVPKENATLDGADLVVMTPARWGDHIRRRGEELGAGDVVYQPGQRIDPLARAALMTAGVTDVVVNRLPVIRVVTSGNEVVEAGAPSRPGQVVDSNGPFLSASAAELVGVATPPPLIVPDDFDELTDALG